MTTRDPPSRDYPRPDSPAGDAGREPTQSLNLAPGELPVPSALALALGTHNRELTRIESPAGRGKTPTPPAASPPAPAWPGGLHHEAPDDYLGCVLGSYRVLELLGKGGMGYVYRAEHIKLGREVALKLLRGDYSTRRDAVARFFQEARTVNRVRHRNIVDVTDFVELDDGTTYIIMELLTGTSLGAWARSGIEQARALAVLVQICDGLAAAHQVGVVHRDLKPDNVIIVPTSDGAELAKLLDFGVAKLLNRDDEDVGFQTQAGSVIGTPAYMSPEQAGGMVIDARSDIYSLGAIMYELFCGQPMFRGRSFGEYVRKHLTETPTPPRHTPGGASVDPQLEAVILRCLEKDADQRFAEIGELREALLYLLGVMETHPPIGAPASAAASVSGVRPPARPIPPTPMLPTAPFLHAPTPYSQASAAQVSGTRLGPRAALAGPPPAHPPHAEISGISGPHAAASQLSGGHPQLRSLGGAYGQAPDAHRTATTPLWLWITGGALAVGLGITAAVWYAARPPHAPLAVAHAPDPAGALAATTPPSVPVGHPAPTTPPAPPATLAGTPAPAAPTPSAPPPEPATPAMPIAPAAPIEVRFDSVPAGGVFSDGSAAELCRTPCTFRIDPGDGGPTDHRAFAIKRDGFVDGAVTVELAGGPREFRVVLQHPAEPAASEHRTTKRGPRPSRATPAKDARNARDARDAAAHDAAAHDARPAAARPALKPAAEPAVEPVEPAAKKPRKSIDPADTLDPFRAKP
jgi:serine/threonine-protein kinase